ncbi:MAG: hypothetical protein AB1483_07650 [Candidatus Zixiibacteriota bacterium]
MTDRKVTVRVLKVAAVIFAVVFITVLSGSAVAQQSGNTSIEIRITTPKSLALFDGDKLAVVYHLENVAGNFIELKASKYNTPQRYQLTVGRVNRFDLKLEELRDFYAFDSLHVTFRPRISASSLADSLIEIGVLRDSRVVRGNYSYTLERDNYEQQPLTEIVVGSGDDSKVIKVLESKPQWKKLVEDLSANPSRRRLTKVIRISSAIAAAGSALWAWQSNNEANNVYDEYMTKIHPVDISAKYREYEDLIEQRNILGAFALVFAATNAATFIFAPGDETDLVREYEAQWGKSGISLDLKPDYQGIAVTVRF